MMQMLLRASLDQGWRFKVPEKMEGTDGIEALGEYAAREV